jgi:hypothetical protein
MKSKPTPTAANSMPKYERIRKIERTILEKI